MLRHALAIVLCCTATTAAAEDWPQFRGPTGQGLSSETALPVEWSAERNIVWRQAVPGTGWSSPVVVGKRVVLTAAVPAEGGGDNLSLDAVCLDAQTGKPLWQTPVFQQDDAAPRIHGKNSHASPTPLVDGDDVFVHFGHQGIACLSLGDGEVRWRNKELSYAPVHGNGGSPALVADRLVFSCDGGSDPFVAAVDRRSGKVLWKTPRPGKLAKKFAFSTPLAITVAGKTQVVSAGSSSVGGFDPQKGREIWRVTYDGYSVIPRPVFGNGLVYISTGYDSPQVLAIRPDGSGDVTETHVAWRLAKGAPHTPSLLLVGQELYMVSDKGIATCVDAKTGRVHWQQRVSGNFSASPVYAGGRIYLQNEEGKGIVLAAKKRFAKLAESDVKERTLASYAIAKGAIFLRTERHLYRIGETDVGK